MKIIHVTGLFVAVAATTSLLAADSPPVAATNAVVTAPVADEVVARVNGTEIKRREVDMAVRGMRMNLARRGRQLTEAEVRQLERDMVDEMVGRELVLQAVTNQPPADLEQRIEQHLTELKTRLGGEEGVTKALAETRITLSDYRRRLRDNLIVDAAISDKVSKEVRISPEEARTFFDANRARFHVPEVARASHILLRVPSDAPAGVKSEKRLQMDVIRARLEQGEKFADVARQVSEDPGSKERGGDLGAFPRGRMVPEFDEAAFTLKTNQLSGVITTQFGYHLLLVTDRKPARDVSFEEAQADIGRMLTGQKQAEVIRQYTEQLRAKAKVEVLLPEPPQTPKPDAP
jgi:peptidyl-prolyl cis-trans isomerase C